MSLQTLIAEEKSLLYDSDLDCVILCTYASTLIGAGGWYLTYYSGTVNTYEIALPKKNLLHSGKIMHVCNNCLVSVILKLKQLLSHSMTSALPCDELSNHFRI